MLLCIVMLLCIFIKLNSRDYFLISCAVNLLQARILTASLAQRVNLESVHDYKLAKTELELVVKAVKSITGMFLRILKNNTG